ncbi:G-protein coupled receptor GRL101-like isoform X2 [Corticium candelabrum]|uniref:G-protein coupled receptor GRL101-like isoform X2 n=1 Tax=Corticium candelabrum TaxID=121492 RepID=UPI002E259651|nr:G-protein coupled receptor GRL101-like isoform X2 [Corticium candelabrum]
MIEDSGRASIVGDETVIHTLDDTEYNYDYYEPSKDVLSSHPFHGVIWMLLSLGIIGNILVVVWRLTQIRGQRSSPLSILIIMLAVSDLVYCVHLILLESLVVDATSSVDVRQYSISIDRAPNKVCTFTRFKQ